MTGVLQRGVHEAEKPRELTRFEARQASLQVRAQVVGGSISSGREERRDINDQSPCQAREDTHGGVPFPTLHAGEVGRVDLGRVPEGFQREPARLT